MLTGLAKHMFGRQVPDMLSGYLALSRRFVKSFPGESKGFEIETEITVSTLEIGLPIAEVACSYPRAPSGCSSKLTAVRDGARILATIARLVRQGRPLLFFGVLAAVLIVLAVSLGIPILVTYLQIHQVPRLPTAVLASALVLLGALSFMSGLILDSVRGAGGRRDDYGTCRYPGRSHTEVRRRIRVPSPAMPHAPSRNSAGQGHPEHHNV